FARGIGARSFRIAPQQSSAAFMGIRFRAMCADFLRQVSADPQCGFEGHVYCSSQNRSFRYLDAESAKTVTITACCCFGMRAVTSKQPNNAAAELGLTNKPSSRARRFTIR